VGHLHGPFPAVPLSSGPDTWRGQSEGSNAFSDYHTYVCLAFLLRWSAQLKEMDFQALMLFFQLPVKHQEWAPRDTEVLLSGEFLVTGREKVDVWCAEGFLWKSIWSAK
jgi:hypothetical protein